MLRYPGKYSLRKKEFFGSQFKIHSIMLGKLRDQDLEAASHMPHRVRKKKSMSSAHFLLLLSSRIAP